MHIAVPVGGTTTPKEFLLMDAPRPTARSGGVIATLAFAGTVAAVMQTLVTPLIAELPKLLDTTSSNAAWVITATLLVSAVCVPVSGRLGDLLGKRRMLLVCAVPLFMRLGGLRALVHRDSHDRGTWSAGHGHGHGAARHRPAA